MRGATSVPHDGPMHAWYYDRPTTPSELVSLTDAQRTARAHWRHEIRRGLAEAAPDETSRLPGLGRLGRRLINRPTRRLPPRALRPAC